MPGWGILIPMIYRFGEFELDTGTGSVVGPDGPVVLRRQTFRLLEVLLRHAPELLDHDTLLDEAWGRTALSPNVLPQAISELRHALGDEAQSPRYIQTLHRRGYRLAVPVEVQDGTSTPDADQPEPIMRRWITRPVVGLAAVGLLLAVALGAWWHQSAEQRWLHDRVIPQVQSLVDSNVTAAWRLALEARRKVGDDPLLEQIWRDLALPVELTSEPTGARIEVAEYRNDADEWTHLGYTPIQDQRLPLGMLRFRVTLPGHVPLEVAPSFLPRAETFHLHRSTEVPQGMVYVPGGSVTYLLEARQLEGFWIDRHEVTNRQFREFITDGGYRDPALWPDSVTIDGQTLSRSRMIEQFVDRTGMTGPSTWSLGTFPDGEEDHPVEGISWYEARAYAQWAGKQLPTAFHWFRAAGLGTPQSANFSDIISASNFGGKATVEVGSLGGLGPYGTYDMAGNVAEWCSNSAGELRHALGGSWQDNSYQFRDVNAFDPLTRRPGFGMRLIKQSEPMPADLLVDLQIPERVTSEPVDDSTFEIYRRLYDYDPLPLDAVIEEVDESHEGWRRERVSFAAAYADERVTAQIFLPRNGESPYQTVVHFPGGDALLLGESHDAGLLHVEPFLRTGRAVVYPVYQGTFERRSSTRPGPIGVRTVIIEQVQDVRRTLDYLETRADIDSERIAFHAISYGASRSPFVLAIENRFRTAMLVSVGLSPSQHLPPEIRQVDYLPRIKVPVLMISGREDFNFPYASSQLPFFERIGTPDARKRHIALDWGHLPPGYTDVTRHILAWSDRWLGKPASD